LSLGPSDQLEEFAPSSWVEEENAAHDARCNVAIAFDPAERHAAVTASNDDATAFGF
jgi:hypothetical protein